MPMGRLQPCKSQAKIISNLLTSVWLHWPRYWSISTARSPSEIFLLRPHSWLIPVRSNYVNFFCIARCSDHRASGGSMVSKGKMWVFNGTASCGHSKLWLGTYDFAKYKIYNYCIYSLTVYKAHHFSRK